MIVRKNHIIDVYIEPGNRMSELVMEYFRNNAVDFIVNDISRQKGAAERMAQISGQKIAPVVEFDGRVIIGFRPDIFDILLGYKSE